MSKALGLLSGGLDSTLAALTLKRQGVAVTGVSFVTPFFGSAKAERAARQIGIPLLVRDIGEVHLDMVKNPRYGYGRNMNPCIDCHAMMFRLASEIMEAEDFDFLFSGEVLGQRPMSQNLNALKAVAKHSGQPNLILRPLSALLLPPTPMEDTGLVDRQALHNIQGRSRRPQEELARELGLTEYPPSGGGCLLTEKSFSGKLRDLFEFNPAATTIDVELLKAGRQFRLGSRARLILGRNRQDNDSIRQLARLEDVLVRIEDVTGPLGMVCGEPLEDDLERAAAITAAYGKGQDREEVSALFQQGEKRWQASVTPFSRDRLKEFQIDGK